MAEDTSVQVIVRSRPFNDRERNESATECLKFHKTTNQVACNGKLFAFDSVQDPSTTQEQAYIASTKSLLARFMRGFNCTILAYGQTGSGKTFTMGTEETTKSMKSDSRGIIPRLVEDMFAFIQESDSPSSYQVSASMLEIYDEKVNDLLSTSRDLQVREQNGQVVVPGLTQVQVKTLEDTMAQLEKGCHLRSKGETAMNATSSRSHAIFTITLEKDAVTEEDAKFIAKLHLVDLAGSERLKKTQAEGDRMREGIRINEGLLALGNVISALAEGGAAARHIPYRDSKITRLLQDSLGGNSYTVMIACISPADTNAEETLSTLRYADRTKKIKNKPVVNIDSDQAIVKQLRQQVAQLQQQLTEVRAGFMPSAKGEDTVEKSIEYTRVKEQLATSEQNLRDAQSKMAEAMIQKVVIARQLIRMEENRDKIVNLVSVAPTLKEDDGSEAANLLRQLCEVINAKIDNETISMDVDMGESHVRHDGDGDTDDDTDADIDGTYQAKYVDRQEQLDKDMEDILQQLKAKELAVQQSIHDQGNLDHIVDQYKSQISELLQKIEELSEEKNRQNAELKKTSTSSKLAEERRRKLADLEKQLAGYRKQVSEMKRLEKTKKDNEDALKKLQNDVLELKQARVRCVKQAREEADKYRQWKQKADRQVAQLKSKEKKMEADMNREKRTKDQQITVLRQKLDEAKKLAKRMDQQRGRANQILDEKTNEKSVAALKTFLKAEIDFVKNSYCAEDICENLKNQRQTLGTQLREAESKLISMKGEEEPANKRRRATNEGGAIVPIDEAAVEAQQAEVNRLAGERDLCSHEMAVLQRGNTIDIDSRSAELWKHVHTLSYAITALNVLFDMAKQFCRIEIDKDADLKAVRTKYANLERDLKEVKKDRKKDLDQYRTAVRELREEVAENNAQARQRYSALLAMAQTGPNLSASQLSALRLDAERGEQIEEALKQTESVSADNIRSIRTRHGVEHYGDVMNSSQAVKDAVGDISCSVPPKKPHHVRRKPRKVDISPIRGNDDYEIETSSATNSTSIESDSGQRKHRNSQIFHQPPSPQTRFSSMDVLEEENIKENTNTAVNTTFIVPDKNETFVKSPEYINKGDDEDVPPIKTKKASVGLGRM